MPCSIPFKDVLNEEQYDVVERGDGYSLVLAGAGSGKTRTVVYRVAYMLQNGVRPEEILLVTFTNKAAREMMDRLAELVGYSVAGVNGGTFHGLCNKWLRRIGGFAGRTSNFTILDADDSKSLIGSIAKEWNLGSSIPKPAVIASLIGFTKNAQADIQEIIAERHPRWRPISETIIKLAHEYERRKVESNAVDFDDLLILFLEFLNSNSERVRRFASQFKYIIVDEFQDTNSVQVRIIEKLAVAHGNVLVVGDDAQSIYGFRAAEIQNILSFPERYTGVKTFYLTSNYRSTPEILALANHAIADNPEQFPKALKSRVDAGDKPVLFTGYTAQQEAEKIADVIAATLDEGERPSEIAVLFRATFHTQALEFELTKRGIRYEYRGGMRFFDRAHIKDMLAVIRLLANKKDEVSWNRFLQHQPNIGPVAARKLIAHVFSCEWETLFGALVPVSGKAAASWMKLGEWLPEAHARSEEKSPAEVCEYVRDAWLADHLEDTFPDASERMEDIEQLIRVAVEYETLDAFLADITLQEDLAQEAERANEATGFETNPNKRIILSTVHQAKGLEWNTVFIMHLLDGAFPSQRSLAEAGGLSEERRLFYVAVTRARKQLYLSYPVLGMQFQSSASVPSVFIRDLPDDLIEREQHASFAGSDDLTYESEDDEWTSGNPNFEHRTERPGSYLS